MPTLDEWAAQVAAALGLPESAVDRNLVLDLARDAAHGVARPAAPLTTYLAGVAVGRGTDPATVAATIRALLPEPPPASTTAQDETAG
jgi:hypothetical protein